MLKLEGIFGPEGKKPASAQAAEKDPTKMLGLGRLLQYPEATGLYFRDQEVHLDGYKFTRCRFDNCRLIVVSGSFQLDHCVIDPSTVAIFLDPAMKIVRLYLNRWNPLPPDLYPFGPQRNADGTISIMGGINQ